MWLKFTKRWLQGIIYHIAKIFTFGLFVLIFGCPPLYTNSLLPGDFGSWESPQTLPALFIGPFEHVERFRNLKFAVIRITGIQSTVLSSFEGTAAIHLAFT